MGCNKNAAVSRSLLILPFYFQAGFELGFVDYRRSSDVPFRADRSTSRIATAVRVSNSNSKETTTLDDRASLIVALRRPLSKRFAAPAAQIIKNLREGARVGGSSGGTRGIREWEKGDDTHAGGGRRMVGKGE